MYSIYSTYYPFLYSQSRRIGRVRELESQKGRQVEIQLGSTSIILVAIIGKLYTEVIIKEKVRKKVRVKVIVKVKVKLQQR